MAGSINAWTAGRVRLGILVSHPVQYYVPWFRFLAERMDVEVFYMHRQDAGGQADAGFGVPFGWDVPLLDGYPFRWLRNVARHPSVGKFRGCDTPEVYRLIREERFDAFLIFGWNRKSAIQTVIACHRNGVPALLRGDSQLRTPRARWRRLAKHLPYRWLLPRLGAHLYVGQRNREYLRHYGVPQDRLFFSPHFVDSELFAAAARAAERSGQVAAARRDLGIPADAFVFLYCGKLIAIKRPDDFVRACTRVLPEPRGARVHALLVGDGPLRGRLEQIASSHAGRIHFAGFRNQSELPTIYRAADVLVLPGYETWGLVVNEAAACGRPAIVSDAVGCAPDMIEDGRTGYVFQVRDVDALAGRMLRIQELMLRDDGRVGRALVEKVDRYSMERATGGLVEALMQVAGASRRPGSGGSRATVAREAERVQ